MRAFFGYSDNNKNVLFSVSRDATANLLPLISQHLINQQGSHCCASLKWLSGRYDSKVNTVGPLDAENFATAILLYVFNIGFPASLLLVFGCNHCNYQNKLDIQKYQYFWGIFRYIYFLIIFPGNISRLFSFIFPFVGNKC